MAVKKGAAGTSILIVGGVAAAGYFLLRQSGMFGGNSSPSSSSSSSTSATGKSSNPAPPSSSSSGASTQPPQPSQTLTAPKVYLKSCPLLRAGATGPDVTSLQQALTYLSKVYNLTGMNPNGVDGIFGSNTASAVRVFQSFCGISTDGIVGQQTYSQLNQKLNAHGGYWTCGAYPSTTSTVPTQTPPPSTTTTSTSTSSTTTSTPPSTYYGTAPRISYTTCQTLQQGSSGVQVKSLQTALTWFAEHRSYAAANPHGIDGIYGSYTASAVHAFQAYMGIQMDGIFGPQTRQNLDYELADGGGYWHCG